MLVEHEVGPAAPNRFQCGGREVKSYPNYVVRSLAGGLQVVDFGADTGFTGHGDQFPDGFEQVTAGCPVPIVMAGGELTLRMLDLEFNSIAKIYEAPLQMKANNGLLVVDDFGALISEAREGVDRIQRVGDDLRGFAHGISGVMEAADLNRLVEEMSHLLRAVISKKARLRLELAPDLPFVQADPAQVGGGVGGRAVGMRPSQNQPPSATTSGRRGLAVTWLKAATSRATSRPVRSSIRRRKRPTALAARD